MERVYLRVDGAALILVSVTSALEKRVYTLKKRVHQAVINYLMTKLGSNLLASKLIKTRIDNLVR